MPIDAAQIQQIFDQSGVPAWPDESEADANRLLQKVLHELDQIQSEYTQRFNLPPQPPLADQIGAEPMRFRALIQALASPMTTVMRTMVYCLLDGASLNSVRFEYRAHASAHLEIEVEYPFGKASGKTSRFTSDDLFDAEVLKHFGMYKLDDKPGLDGYYPL